MGKIFFSSVLVLLGAQVLAQPGGGFDETQVITGDRTLTVDNAYKISDMPATIESNIVIPELKYTLIPKRIATQITVDTIPPAKLNVREALAKLYKNYAVAGVGNYATPFVEFYHNSIRSRDWAYGAHLKHYSSNKGIKNWAYSGFSESLAELWATKYLKKHSLSGKGWFNHDVVHYYGFDPQDEEIDREKFRQRFNTFGVDLELQSFYNDSSRINHNINLDFYQLNDRYNAGETGINLHGDLLKYIENNLFRADFGFDFVGYKAIENRRFDFLPDFDLVDLLPPDEVTRNNAILNFSPQIIKQTDKLKALVGIGLYSQMQNTARFHAFPDAEVSYSLFNDIFIPYAGITGGVERNSYRTITDENPWVLSELEFRNTVIKYDIFGGIRGSLGPSTSFNFKVSQKKANDTPLFVNDTLFSKENRFNVVYDDLNIFTMLGEISFHNSDKLELLLRGEIFAYGTENEQEAWHLPSYEITLAGNYNLYNKLLLKAKVFAVGKRKAKSLMPVPDKDIQYHPEGNFYITELDPYLDLSLGVEYRYTKRLSAFLDMNNILASKYDIYYRFRAQRITLLGGLKYSF